MHSRNLILIALAEADDVERERRRRDMGEPYRTLLGHFRHEVGHYYWDILVRDAGNLHAFRAVFGDDREDYQTALKRHYDLGVPHDWQDILCRPMPPLTPGRILQKHGPITCT